MTAPRIGVTAALRVEGGRERVSVPSVYARALSVNGALPLVLPPTVPPSHAPALLGGLDGLLLTGGADVDPARYGARPSPRLGRVEPERDAFETGLLRAARELGLPVLAICRGIQLLNVTLGGSLVQDLPTERPGGVDHDPEGLRTARRHRVQLTPGCRAAEALGTAELAVNSTHHQGIAAVAPELTATGWAEDGLVEAVEAADRWWCVGVQWHPEEMHADPDAPEHGLFRAFAAAAADARAARQ